MKKVSFVSDINAIMSTFFFFFTNITGLFLEYLSSSISFLPDFFWTGCSSRCYIKRSIQVTGSFPPASLGFMVTTKWVHSLNSFKNFLLNCSSSFFCIEHLISNADQLLFALLSGFYSHRFFWVCNFSWSCTKSSYPLAVIILMIFMSSDNQT